MSKGVERTWASIILESFISVPEISSCVLGRLKMSLRRWRRFRSSNIVYDGKEGTKVEAKV
jgi:hypothetical protein